ncbi:MAG: Zn-ribbon domain-containing OB-fold protein [Candidatus Bathyarchaeota archaeon]|nr:MAG: Zn-ribbon domain-containing OB-fold protein [Candidatus Bathyarchaeota archaeon]
MAETSIPFTIEGFYKFIQNGQLMGAVCNKCGKLSLPPKPICTKCLSRDLKWKELPQQGKLLTYTIIHISPKQFQSMTPYVVGIVQLGDGAQLPGMIRDIDLDNVKIGMNLTMEFEKEIISKDWPQWPRYYFKPI